MYVRFPPVDRAERFQPTHELRLDNTAVRRTDPSRIFPVDAVPHLFRDDASCYCESSVDTMRRGQVYRPRVWKAKPRSTVHTVVPLVDVHTCGLQ